MGQLILSDGWHRRAVKEVPQRQVPKDDGRRFEKRWYGTREIVAFLALEDMETPVQWHKTRALPAQRLPRGYRFWGPDVNEFLEKLNAAT